MDALGPAWQPLSPAWAAIENWWLEYPTYANTPNWDIVLGCEYAGTPALVLVEAKAHEQELDTCGKTPPNATSIRSQRNHERIGEAIAMARSGYAAAGLPVGIDRDTHYQLSNRLAFLWRLAQEGIPTVLVYLGFTGDRVFGSGVVPFRNDDHWQEVFAEYSASVLPRSMINACLGIGPAPAWFLVRSRPVLELSVDV